MVDFEVITDEEAKEFLNHLPEKSRNIIKAKLSILKTDPFRALAATKSCSIRPSIKKFIDCTFPDLIPPFIVLKGKTW